MNHKWLLALTILLITTLFASTAIAQTSMQRRAQQEQEQQQGEETHQETQTTTTQQERQRTPEREVYREERPTDGIFQFYRAHKPGLRLDLGIADGRPGIFGIGLGYMFAMGWEITVFNEVVGVLRGGIGPDVTFQVSEEGFQGVAGFMKGRIHAISSAAGGLGLEAGIGSGISGRGLAPATRLGVYYSGRYFEIGYFYQATFFDRPDQMRAHNIGLRLHIPLLQF